MIGLVLAGMFSHTMAMSSSDANAIILTKYAFSSQIAELNGSWTTTITVAGPILVSLFVFSICGVLRPWRNAASDQLVEAVNTDLPAGEDRMVVHA